ncbi:MAG: pyruvate, phosphate dikinase, partial [Phycisphaerae bacterium]|nr:pyruvate, phosphate dikinase [Phycisphaerae bacterium]
LEFTIENGKLWLLQTRDGKRTAQAEVRIAVDMVEEGLISKEEAVGRVHPDQVDFFLHPQLDEEARKEHQPIAQGLNVSPGAAVGVIAFDADTAERWAKEEGKKVIMVRPETKPDDVHGMLAAEGILTSRGGRTSHAALVARQFGTPAVVGVSELEIDLVNRQMAIEDLVVKEGEWVSLDGTNGLVYLGKLNTVIPDFNNPYLLRLLEWADEIRTLGVWANADYPKDAKRARQYGAEGIGLCRTEHMFFEGDRIIAMREMILAEDEAGRKKALAKLLPLQRRDFIGIFRALKGRPATIRLLDPPLHEFLPHDQAGQAEMAKVMGVSAAKIKAAVEALHEFNPMLGFRGCRLGTIYPEITATQARAIFEAAFEVRGAQPEIMVPLVGHVKELAIQKRIILDTLADVLARRGKKKPPFEYKIGTMIEVPRGALTADEVATEAEFFSFGTNDLTQMACGFSRDDAGKFLKPYVAKGIYDADPFQVLDRSGVGELVRIAVQKGRAARPDLKLG